MKFGSAGAFARARERVDTIKRAMRPDCARRAPWRGGASQTMVANALETPRPNVAWIEKAVDIRLSTLERCVEALGGTLEIHPSSTTACLRQACAASSHLGSLARSHRLLCLSSVTKERSLVLSAAAATRLPPAPVAPTGWPPKTARSSQIGSVATGRLWRQTFAQPRGSLEP